MKIMLPLRIFVMCNLVKVSTRVLDTSERQNRFEDWILHLSTFEIELVFQMIWFGFPSKESTLWQDGTALHGEYTVLVCICMAMGLFGLWQILTRNKLGPVSKTCMLAQTNPQSCVQSWGRFGLHWQPKKNWCHRGQLLAAKVDNGEAKLFFCVGKRPNEVNWSGDPNALSGSAGRACCGVGFSQEIS